MKDGWSRDKKRGSHRYDRIPIQLFDIISLDSPFDYKLKYLPESLFEAEFTTADFAREARTSRQAAYYALTVLNAANVVSKVGKKGNSYLYKCLL